MKLKKYTIMIMMMAATLLLIGCTEQTKQVTNFEECAQYYEVMESDPMVCRTPDGKEFIEPVACTMEYNPVCGIDGNTYGNPCVAERQNNVAIAYMGECGEENAFLEPRICTREYNPVCGMDKVTYSNPCMAGDMQIAYEGECTNEKSKVICTSEQKTAEICTLEFRPVCGNNNKTYSNPCMACASSEIEYWTEGEC
ncbi:MAG: Kazal-type serine protease inhibitor family protein [Candidatus Woesearchaeota archaeon]